MHGTLESPVKGWEERRKGEGEKEGEEGRRKGEEKEGGRGEKEGGGREGGRGEKEGGEGRESKGGGDKWFKTDSSTCSRLSIFKLMYRSLKKSLFH